MKKKKMLKLIIFGAILFFLYKFYLEFSKNQKIKKEEEKRQQEIDDALYAKTAEGKKHKDWEYKANKLLDPGNLFGFR